MKKIKRKKIRIKLIKEIENEEKELNKAYEKKLEELKKQCCKELKALDNKLDKAQKNKTPNFIPYNYKSYEDFIEFINLNIIPPLFNLTDFNYEIMKKSNNSI